MANIFIVHGAYGNPEENWIPWLKEKLEGEGHKVFVPKFPTPKNQTLSEWNGVFHKYEDYFTPDSIVIGHSLGVAFLLRFLGRGTARIKAAFFVSGFTGGLNNSDFDTINASFIHKKFWFAKVKENCKKIFIFHSDNDPYVPMSEAKTLEKNLGGKLIIIKGGGHFNEQAGYTKFEELLEEIKSILNRG